MFFPIEAAAAKVMYFFSFTAHFESAFYVPETLLLYCWQLKLSFLTILFLGFHWSTHQSSFGTDPNYFWTDLHKPQCCLYVFVFVLFQIPGYRAEWSCQEGVIHDSRLACTFFYYWSLNMLSKNVLVTFKKMLKQYDWVGKFYVNNKRIGFFIVRMSPTVLFCCSFFIVF